MPFNHDCFDESDRQMVTENRRIWPGEPAGDAGAVGEERDIADGDMWRVGGTAGEGDVTHQKLPDHGC